jgi:hypothetical protein
MRSHQQKFMADLEQGLARDGLELVVDQQYGNTGNITIGFEESYEPIVMISFQFNGDYATFDAAEKKEVHQYALVNPDRADMDDKAMGRYWWYLRPDEFPQILKAIRTQCAIAINERRAAEIASFTK